MKKIGLIAIAVLLVLAGCSKADIYDAEVQVKSNAEKIFGNIDPRQDWNLIQSGTVTITANAPLSDVVKVQILTESPFGNPYAKVLNEAAVKKDGTVTLVYDAPNHLDQLVAACVSSKGAYYIRVFSVGTKSVDFNFGTANARTRAAETYPNVQAIALGEPVKSFNALRAEAALGSSYGTVEMSDNTNGSGKKYYTLWQDGSWAGDRQWAVSSVSDATWKIDNGAIYKAAEALSDDEAATLQAVIDTYLQKTGGSATTSGTNKRNNWKDIVSNSSIFEVYNNYLISDGSPLTVTPLQMNTTEGHFNSIYYYYYNPSATLGMTSEQEADFIKGLPKFKAVPGFKGDSKLRRQKEYLLPYYGENPMPGAHAVSNSIPRGYKIGFLNKKNFANGGNVKNCGSACVYGDGRLNYEVNHIVGHYFSAMSQDVSQQVYKDSTATQAETQKGKTPAGMDFTSPRIAMFTANEKTYMCFEDGADCNFTDMILEIGHGIELVVDQPEVANAVYTMCFEDRPNSADYDMNDVVLRCYRAGNELEVTLVAAGGNDDVYIYGTGISKFDGNEVHAIFHATDVDANGNRFVNTVKNGTRRGHISEWVTVPAGTTIPQYLKGVYIINKTTGNQKIEYPKKVGEPPYAIIIPDEFQYPLENVRIDQAYMKFTEWAQNINVSNDWYMYEEAGKFFNVTGN